ncbi:phage virion morphogenesis protein [Bosea sp. (in: a-proteobacteria)]|uniref:phage virion morphogenesis protein n=1 Tax=Bosea sp. (in: a-proteobacteria) TaxID=1871050 RepID=UPI002736589A|nr:phage virion morphogenesis protein [Bosea sp. (in: a-proteobacteria)]MDP3408199.1 phage virion morphogenesis protein [Bosea sp. (in: a-proteobacteria)]
MSGAVLITRMDWSDARAAFGRLERAIADTTPIMGAIGTGLVASTQDRMDAGQDPEGAAFAALNPLYASAKRGPGILRESGMRGGLQGSITRRAGRDQVEVGTNKIYGAIHQYGGVITAKGGGKLAFRMGGRLIKTASVTIPARPYLGISRDDQVMILDVVEGALDRAVGSGASSGGRR